MAAKTLDTSEGDVIVSDINNYYYDNYIKYTNKIIL